MGAVAAIGGLILGAASTTAQVIQEKKQAKTAKQATAQADKDRQALLTEQTALDAKAATNDARAKQAGDLQRRRAAAAGGRSSTLLTGGQGLTDAAPTQLKTLLGT